MLPVLVNEVGMDVRHAVIVGGLAEGAGSGAGLPHVGVVPLALTVGGPGGALLVQVLTSLVLDDTLMTRLGAVDMHVAPVLVTLSVGRPLGTLGVPVTATLGISSEEEHHSNRSSIGQSETVLHLDRSGP